MKRRRPMKRQPRRRDPASDEARAAFRAAVEGRPCVACEHDGVPTIGRVDAHHPIRRQHLEREGVDPWLAGWAVPLCRDHHAAHHAGGPGRIALRLLPGRVGVLAEEHGLWWLLVREHPADPGTRTGMEDA